MARVRKTRQLKDETVKGVVNRDRIEGRPSKRATNEQNPQPEAVDAFFDRFTARKDVAAIMRRLAQ
jgi:hypothetical protein